MIAAGSDAVLRFLISTNLTHNEDEFRGLIDTVSKDEKVTAREITIAAVGILMILGQLKWTVVLKVMQALNKLKNDELSATSVALVNGDILILPATGDAPPYMLEIATLKEYKGDVEPFVTNYYTTAAIWKKAIEACV